MMDLKFFNVGFNKGSFYLSGDLDNTNFDKMSYKFYLGTLHDFRDSELLISK